MDEEEERRAELRASCAPPPARSRASRTSPSARKPNNAQSSSPDGCATTAALCTQVRSNPPTSDTRRVGQLRRWLARRDLAARRRGHPHVGASPLWRPASLVIGDRARRASLRPDHHLARRDRVLAREGTRETCLACPQLARCIHTML